MCTHTRSGYCFLYLTYQTAMMNSKTIFADFGEAQLSVSVFIYLRALAKCYMALVHGLNARTPPSIVSSTYIQADLPCRTACIQVRRTLNLGPLEKRHWMLSSLSRQASCFLSVLVLVHGLHLKVSLSWTSSCRAIEFGNDLAVHPDSNS